jgi:hypothetical protein
MEEIVKKKTVNSITFRKAEEDRFQFSGSVWPFAFFSFSLQVLFGLQKGAD